MTGNSPTVFGTEPWRMGHRRAFRQQCAAGAQYRRLVGHVARRLPRWTREKLIAALDAVGVPCGAINSVAEVFEDPQVQARGMLTHVPHPSGVDMPQLASPMRFADAPLQTQSAPPLLGQHSDAILAELGYLASKAIRHVLARRLGPVRIAVGARRQRHGGAGVEQRLHLGRQGFDRRLVGAVLLFDTRTAAALQGLQRRVNELVLVRQVTGQQGQQAVRLAQRGPTFVGVVSVHAAQVRQHARHEGAQRLVNGLVGLVACGRCVAAGCCARQARSVFDLQGAHGVSN